jgi:DNA repair exonuclease SbcCD ATPase subunit
MKLRRLRIEHFKRFRDPLTIEGFADGLNLFAAPNEAGKSTIAEAIRAAFFERHRSSSVDHLRPWGEPSATPTVEVEFEIAGTPYRLTKAFLGRKRCDLVIDGRQTLDGVAAEDHLAGLLGFRFPGKGASTPEHMGIPGLLWIRQGTSHELADAVAHAADHLRQVLGESLGDLTSSTGDALLHRVETARNELLTPVGGSARGDYAAALKHQEELADAIDTLTRDIDAYRHSVDRLAGLRLEHERDERTRPWAAIRQDLQRAQERLDRARGLEASLQESQSEAERWRLQASAARTHLDALAHDEEAVAKRARGVEAAESAVIVAQAEVDRWEQQHRHAVDTETQARRTLEQVRAVSARAAQLRSAEDLDASVRKLGVALEKARVEKTRVDQLEAEAARLAVAPADLKTLKQRSEQLRDVSVRLETVATSLTFDLDDGRSVRADGEAVSGQARRTVVRRTEIEIEGVGRIFVTPGGADLDSLAARRDGLSTEVAALLERLAVANLAEAEERARLSTQRSSEAQASRKVLDTLAPDGVEALEAEHARAGERLNAIRTALAQLPPAADSDGDVPPSDRAEAAAAEARSTLESVAQTLSTARVALGRAQSDRANALQELDAARRTLDDPKRGERVDAARTSLQDAISKEASARQSAEAIEAEWKTANVSLLHQDVRRLTDSAVSQEEAHRQRASEILRCESELAAHGALGLEEKRAEQERELGAASRRVEELGRRAAALDHLLRLLQEKRAALARRLRAPLQRHLDRYLNILFPGARIEVADDLSPGAITRPGPRGTESGEFEALSLGTREQMGIVARLAYADLLQEAGKPTLLILDDALVNTDEDRLGQMKRVLYDAAARHQVLIFTCHPAAWRDLGVVSRTIGP